MTAPWIAAFILQWIVLLLLCVLLLGVLSRMGDLGQSEVLATASTPVTSLIDGDVIPVFHARTLSGDDWSSVELLGQHRRGILLVGTKECHACGILDRELIELSNRFDGIANLETTILLLLIGRDALGDSHGGSEYELSTTTDVLVLRDEDGVALRDFRVRSVPVGIAFNAEGEIVSQSRNPHAGWLYEVLSVPQPDEPILDGPVPIITG
jgi:hypothetical protein